MDPGLPDPKDRHDGEMHTYSHASNNVDFDISLNDVNASVTRRPNRRVTA